MLGNGKKNYVDTASLLKFSSYVVVLFRVMAGTTAADPEPVTIHLDEKHAEASEVSKIWIQTGEVEVYRAPASETKTNILVSDKEGITSLENDTVDRVSNMYEERAEVPGGQVPLYNIQDIGANSYPRTPLRRFVAGAICLALSSATLTQAIQMGRITDDLGLSLAIESFKRSEKYVASLPLWSLMPEKDHVLDPNNDEVIKKLENQFKAAWEAFPDVRSTYGTYRLVVQKCKSITPATRYHQKFQLFPPASEIESQHPIHSRPDNANTPIQNRGREICLTHARSSILEPNLQMQIGKEQRAAAEDDDDLARLSFRKRTKVERHQIADLKLAMAQRNSLR
ncbi:hypothetical protein MBM_03924 [Drepanopeziza brunnea f. sp. 'multigermtubi' MB_m1]|uniref:Uncharacterized protein n=1 Tax=Marssonina brunnea f. sp. multigermtubi (strain MB_m1) TaxID=1072389 RepID=K1WZU2_MARBU|nr:uncharacterized protein MBM_03924 [Drepanopeziza brunnea f. sp. 'multigermtubi' MB_m1]EKD18152.1 hypothetical protein MBM_03924 [Drepanopeziza brunnea f. sp. 'multigermtubi' MB_m1]